MKANTPRTVVALFETHERAERAVEELRAAGFTDARIEVRPAPAGAEVASGPPTWENGAGLGGLTGAALGGLAAGPPGMAAGALAGLLLGALLDLGIPEQDARWYAEGAEGGQPVVTVGADVRRDEAQEILRRHGARQPGSEGASEAAT